MSCFDTGLCGGECQAIAFRRVLSLPDAERARAIGELHQRSGGAALAEFLIDLEEDPDGEHLRAWVRNELRRIERES